MSPLIGDVAFALAQHVRSERPWQMTWLRIDEDLYVTEAGAVGSDGVSIQQYGPQVWS